MSCAIEDLRTDHCGDGVFRVWLPVRACTSRGLNDDPLLVQAMSERLLPQALKNGLSVEWRKADKTGVSALVYLHQWPDLAAMESLAKEVQQHATELMDRLMQVRDAMFALAKAGRLPAASLS